MLNGLHKKFFGPINDKSFTSVRKFYFSLTLHKFGFSRPIKTSHTNLVLT